MDASCIPKQFAFRVEGCAKVGWCDQHCAESRQRTEAPKRNASRLRRSLIAAIAATLLMLSGCIETDLSIDVSGITVTPLPSIFYVSDVDDSGHRFANASGKATITKVELRGDIYFAGKGKLRFVALNPARNTFLLQAAYPTYYAYAILRLRQDQMQILTFTDNNHFRNILKTANVNFVEHDSTIFFADKQQLLAGFHALEEWFGQDEADITETFVLPERLAYLQQLVDSANRSQALASTTTPTPPPNSAPVSPPAPQVRDRAGFLQFDDGGYTNTVLLDEFYLDDTEHLRVGPISQYFQAFVERLKQMRGCDRTISDAAYAVLSTRAIAGMAGGMFGNRESNTLNDALSPGAHNLLQFDEPSVAGNLDARLFFSRHGCLSAEAHQIFQTLERWAISPN